MKRQTTVSLLAAAAFGVIMAAATSANGEINTGAQSNNEHQYCATDTWRACVARCRQPGSTAEQTASCEHQCTLREDPLDCMYARPAQTPVSNRAAQGTLRRP